MTYNIHPKFIIPIKNQNNIKNLANPEHLIYQLWCSERCKTIIFPLSHLLPTTYLLLLNVLELIIGQFICIDSPPPAFIDHMDFP